MLSDYYTVSSHYHFPTQLYFKINVTSSGIVIKTDKTHSLITRCKCFVQTIYFTAISRHIQYYFADQLSLSDSDSSKSSLRNSGIDGMMEVEIADGLEVGFKGQVFGVARILLIRLEMYDCK